MLTAFISIPIFVVALMMLWPLARFFIRHCRKLSLAESLLWCLAFSLYFYHWMMAPYNWNGMDTSGHIVYVTFILNNYRAPPISGAWEWYQPLLYYIMAAVFMYISTALYDIKDFFLFDPFHRFYSPGNYKLLQLFSLYWFAGYVFFMREVVSQIISRRSGFFLTLSFLFFWPIGQAIATRINNDIPVYTGMAACIYFLSVWIENKKPDYIFYALIATALSLACKTSAMLLYAVIFYCLLSNKELFPFIKKHLHGKLFRLTIIITLLAVGSNFGRAYYEKYTHNLQQSVVVGNIKNLGRDLLVGSDIKNYLGFDEKSYLHDPYFRTFIDEGGRQYFLNTILKTSLFGEFLWSYPILAQILAICLLFIVIYTFASLPFVFASLPDLTKKRLKLLLQTMFWMILALGFSRWRFPFSCSNDVRYVFPVTGILSILYVFVIFEHAQKRRAILSLLGFTFGIFFIELSIAFGVLQHVPEYYFGSFAHFTWK